MNIHNLPKSYDLYIKNFILIVLAFASIFWITYNTQILKINKETFGITFGSLLTLMSISGALYSFVRSYAWGFYRSSMGQALIFIGFGLLMWSIGEVFYLIDSVIDNPLNLYDFFFVLIDPFYLIGIYLVSKSIGTFKNYLSNINLIILPILILILNYILISLLKNNDLITSFFELDVNSIFIAGSVILATLVVSIMIFSKKLGGIYKQALNLILIGILFQYIGDNLFEIYVEMQENGSLADLLFFLSVSLVTFGVYSLNPNKLNEKRS